MSAPPSSKANRPRWWHQGHDPDYRFTLANERTFLAWVRTALSILAGAVFLDQFATKIGPAWVVATVAAALALFAAVMSVFAYRHWRSSEIAMRLGRPLAPTPMTIATAVVTATVAVLLACLILGLPDG